jgi:hypothetical protein
MNNIDRASVVSLMNKYGIKKTTFYERLKRLGITPTKEGHRAYLNAEEIILMDRLHEHLKNGGSLNSFKYNNDKKVTKENSDKTFILEDRSDVKHEQLISAILMVSAKISQDVSAAIANALNEKTQTVFEEQLCLDLVAEKKWVLPTSKISEIIGKKARGKQPIYRGNWEIIPTSKKIGREKGWIVKRITQEDLVLPSSMNGKSLLENQNLELIESNS